MNTAFVEHISRQFDEPSPNLIVTDPIYAKYLAYQSAVDYNDKAKLLYREELKTQSRQFEFLIDLSEYDTFFKDNPQFPKS